ncbi:MAG TPA: PilN domain-containing protein [Gaiellaceae bacterium]|nr:PilN domain-containing protein [Gaiellaceae bacterium]
MRAVNLLPPDRRGGQKAASLSPFVRDPLLIGAVAFAVLVSALVGVLSHSASSSVAAKRDQIRRLDDRLAKLEPATPSAATAGLGSRLTAVTSIAGQRTTWDGFLGALSRVVPEDVWLLSLSAQAPAPAAPAASGTAATSSSPSGMTVTGYTYSQPSVARMMRRLELVPWLQNVNLVTSTKTAIAEHTVYQFTVGASFVTPTEVGT